MTEPDNPRLSSAYLEDLAYIVLSAQSGRQDFDLHPALDDNVRARLRSRVKQLSRYDWPSTLNEDPALRRGYSLRQCFRLLVALVLLDAHLPPSVVVALARNNELSFLTAIGNRLSGPAAGTPAADDLVAVIIPAEIQDALSFADRTAVQGDRVRLVRRDDLANIWSGDLAGAGARLVVDIGLPAVAVWRWIRERRLLNDEALSTVLTEIERSADEPGFAPLATARLRR